MAQLCRQLRVLGCLRLAAMGFCAISLCLFPTQVGSLVLEGQNEFQNCVERGRFLAA